MGVCSFATAFTERLIELNDQKLFSVGLSKIPFSRKSKKILKVNNSKMGTELKKMVNIVIFHRKLLRLVAINI